MAITHSRFDFDYWMNLSKSDPKLFEIQRREAVEKEILKAPEHRREKLRRLQWRIDMERSRASNPLSGCIRLNKMMMDELYKAGGLRDSLFLLRDSLLKFPCENDGKNHAPKKGKIISLLPAKK